MNIQLIPLSLLDPHPQNPRLAPRQDVVDQIATQIQVTGKFEPMYALIVRPCGTRYQIVSGHHRTLAAQQVGLTDVPCWVQGMTDDEAYMALVLTNIQGELHPLEEGRHALESGLEIKDYAERVGKKYPTLMHKVYAATVLQNINIDILDVCDTWMALATIHPAPEWLWPALVTQLHTEHWTVDVTRSHVKPFQKLDAPPVWSDTNIIATALVGETLKPADIPRFSSIASASIAKIHQAGEDADRFVQILDERLLAAHPSKLSQVTSVCQAVEQEQVDLVKERKQADLFRVRREEEIAARTASLRRNVSLEEWETLAPDEQHALLHLSPQDVVAIHFVKQDNDAIEWAQFSWNPVTGCLHNCPYCYARDIAENPKFTKAFPNSFAPTFRPATLLAPRHMKVPKEADDDARYRNVFTCSMADLFGRWVPREWIEAVFHEIREASQWNFLCLTKFPKRLNEFDIPPNAWMGTTVDMQARVKAAEDAFEHITTGVRWLSVEPMLEQLTFKHLDRFNWIVIGGASKQSQTPEWRPPHAWIKDLEKQADDAGVKVYYKTNLLGKRRLELPFPAPMPDDTELPDPVFNYLKIKGVANGLE